MPKKAKKARVPREKKAKKETAPKLAPFVDSPFPIYLVHEGKERTATVLSSGLIRFKEEEYKSPCAVATAMAKDLGFKWNLNAWSALKFNRDGERVPLDKIRGAKSPLKAAAPKAAKKEAKPKASKRPKASAAGSSSTSKKARKPRAASASKPTNGHAAVEAPSHGPAKEESSEAIPF
jgi:hypothetical protein